MTLPVINNSAAIMFLVSTPDKTEILHLVQDGPNDPDEMPAQAVQPVSGELFWMADAESAREVSLKERVSH